MVQVEVDRRVSEGFLKEATRLIQQLRKEASRTAGFVDGYLLQRVDDSHRIESTATWSSLKGWQVWETSEVRHNIDMKIAPMLDEPAATRISIPLVQELQ